MDGLNVGAELAEELRERTELLADAVVVVAPPRVTRDGARELGLLIFLLGAASVLAREADHRSCAEEDRVAVEPAPRLRGAREPVHAAMHAARDERLVAREIRLERQIGARDGHGVEAEPARLRDDAILHAARPPGSDEAIMRRMIIT